MQPALSRLEPFFSPRIWGQRSLAPWYPEKVNLKEPLGEAWLTAFDSRVSNGPLGTRESNAVSHASPRGSFRFTFSGYQGASERLPQILGLEKGSRAQKAGGRKGAGEGKRVD